MKFLMILAAVLFFGFFVEKILPIIGGLFLIWLIFIIFKFSAFV